MKNNNDKKQFKNFLKSNSDGIETSKGNDSKKANKKKFKIPDNDKETEVIIEKCITDYNDDKSNIGSSFKDNQENKPKKSKSEIIKKILQRYQERKGKQLYIRFPHKLPETQTILEEKIKELAPLAVKVHKPRQKHARFCLIDFNHTEDRDMTFKKLKKSIKKGELAKYVVRLPRTEDTDVVSELAERKIKSIENKKAKARLKKASKKALKGKTFTSTVIVSNLPKTASYLQIHELFKNAIDIQIKPGKGKFNKDKSIAAITLPTTIDARNAIKKRLSLGGNQLVIKFDNQKLKTRKKLDINESNNKETIGKITESK